MSDEKKTQPHSLILENRQNLHLTGITDVGEFDEQLIRTVTSMGGLLVRGKRLHISQLDLASGDLVVITAGVPLGIPGTTNLLKVQTVGDVILHGMGIGGGNVKAGVCVAKSEREALQNFKAGDILVIDSTTNELLDVMKKASGIITAQPGVNSHAAIVGLALNIPVIVGAKDCTQILRNGTSILLDASKGIVCNLTNQQD